LYNPGSGSTSSNGSAFAQTGISDADFFLAMRIAIR
jgi:hypothetical protein